MAADKVLHLNRRVLVRLNRLQDVAFREAATRLGEEPAVFARRALVARTTKVLTSNRRSR